mmetsp:Transcript_62799/g.111563  ORF Transcript_62799/g.111563 Transcript_62799/m.111563 type:complete len:99 (+) Transcript_62799:3-299(+)
MCLSAPVGDACSLRYLKILQAFCRLCLKNLEQLAAVKLRMAFLMLMATWMLTRRMPIANKMVSRHAQTFMISCDQQTTKPPDEHYSLQVQQAPTSETS